MANFALNSSNLPFFFPKFPKFAIFLPPPLTQNIVLLNRCDSAPHNSYLQASGGGLIEGVKMDLASAPQEKKEAEVYLWCFSLYFSWLAHKYTFLILQSHLQLCVHIQDYYWSPKTGGKVNLEYEPVSFLSCHKQSPRKCYSTRFLYSNTFLDSVFFLVLTRACFVGHTVEIAHYLYQIHLL